MGVIAMSERAEEREFCIDDAQIGDVWWGEEGERDYAEFFPRARAVSVVEDDYYPGDEVTLEKVTIIGRGVLERSWTADGDLSVKVLGTVPERFDTVLHTFGEQHWSYDTIDELTESDGRIEREELPDTEEVLFAVVDVKRFVLGLALEDITTPSESAVDNVLPVASAPTGHATANSASPPTAHTG